MPSIARIAFLRAPTPAPIYAHTPTTRPRAYRPSQTGSEPPERTAGTNSRNEPPLPLRPRSVKSISQNRMRKANGERFFFFFFFFITRIYIRIESVFSLKKIIARMTGAPVLFSKYPTLAANSAPCKIPRGCLSNAQFSKNALTKQPAPCAPFDVRLS